MRFTGSIPIRAQTRNRRGSPLRARPRRKSGADLFRPRITAWEQPERLGLRAGVQSFSRKQGQALYREPAARPAQKDGRQQGARAREPAARQAHWSEREQDARTRAWPFPGPGPKQSGQAPGRQAHEPAQPPWLSSRSLAPEARPEGLRAVRMKSLRMPGSLRIR